MNNIAFSYGKAYIIAHNLISTLIIAMCFVFSSFGLSIIFFDPLNTEIPKYVGLIIIAIVNGWTYGFHDSLCHITEITNEHISYRMLLWKKNLKFSDIKRIESSLYQQRKDYSLHKYKDRESIKILKKKGLLKTIRFRDIEPSKNASRFMKEQLAKAQQASTNDTTEGKAMPL